MGTGPADVETKPRSAMERIAVLEAKVRLISLMLKGTIAAIVAVVVGYFTNR
jgi:hypothetical protein